MSVSLTVGNGAILSRTPADPSTVSVKVGQGVILERVPQDASSEVTWWGDNPDGWDAIWLDGERMPGLSRITGDVGIRITRKAVPGKHGKTTIQKGYDAAKLRIEVALWTKEDLEDWAKMLQTLRPKAGRGQPSIVSIDHPNTQLYGIYFVEIIRIGLLQQQEPSMDIYTFSMEVLEHFQQPTANKGKVQQAGFANRPTAIPLNSPAPTPPSPQALTASTPSATNARP